MLKKVLSLVLTGLLINFVAVSSSYAQSQDEQARTAKVKENVRKLGLGEEARIEVKLHDGRKLKGYIQEAGEDNFTIIDSTNGTATTVAYSQVKELKGRNRSTAAKVGINVAKGVGVVAVVAGIALLLGIVIAKGTKMNHFYARIIHLIDGRNSHLRRLPRSTAKSFKRSRPRCASSNSASTPAIQNYPPINFLVLSHAQ